MKFLSCGEVLWDVINGVEHLGGAPLNFGAHVSLMGVKSYLVSALGQDERGDRMLERINSLNIDTTYMQRTDKYPTGWVDVALAGEGIPTFTIHENVAWDHIQYTDELKAFIEKNIFDVFCFGVLPQRNQESRDTLYKILDTIRAKEIFVDVNMRQDYFSKEILEESFRYASVIKMNEDEVVMIHNLLYSGNFDENIFAQKILQDFNVKIILSTKGPDGAILYTKDDTIQVLGIPISVADTVGAGDSFSAGFLIKYLQTGNLQESAEFANKVGAYVASQSGGVPENAEYLEKLQEFGLSK